MSQPTDVEADLSAIKALRAEKIRKHHSLSNETNSVCKYNLAAHLVAICLLLTITGFWITSAQTSQATKFKLIIELKITRCFVPDADFTQLLAEMPRGREKLRKHLDLNKQMRHPINGLNTTIAKLMEENQLVEKLIRHIQQDPAP
jgi:hypothetical protein